MTVTSLPLRVDESEVLRYLGFPRGSTGATTGPAGRHAAVLLAKARAWAEGQIRPLASHATFDASIAERLVDRQGMPAAGSASLSALLAASARVTVMAVTAGAALDLQTSRLSAAGRMAEAAVLDALGSDAVEEAANDLCSALSREAAACGMRLTRRFSPGYGDLSLDYQPALVEASGAREIGVSVSESMMLSPMKSVTAIVGWEPEGLPEQPNTPAPCDSCGLGSCGFRRSRHKE